MSTKISDIFDLCISFLFPTRNKEKIVHRLSDADISALPRLHKQFPGIISLFSYKNSDIQALIWELKYHRNNKAFTLVGKLLADALLEELSDKMLFENWQAILLIPIPITNVHRRERTFSQTELLCTEMLSHLPDTVIYTPQALTKVRETEKQSRTTSRTQRLHNLRGAFSANITLVHNKNVVLIDDVTTTGATIHEATRALKTAGAKHVLALTIAH